MQEQMSNVSKEIEILRKKQKEVLEIKSTVIEINNAFDGLINSLNTAEEKISEMEGLAIATSKTKN